MIVSDVLLQFLTKIGLNENQYIIFYSLVIAIITAINYCCYYKLINIRRKFSVSNYFLKIKI